MSGVEKEGGEGYEGGGRRREEGMERGEWKEEIEGLGWCDVGDEGEGGGTGEPGGRKRW